MKHQELDVVIQPESKDLRTRAALGPSPRVPKPKNQKSVQGEDKMDSLAQEERKGICPSFAFFVLFRLSVDWTLPSPIGKGTSFLLGLLNQILIFCTNTFVDTPRNNVFPAI